MLERTNSPFKTIEPRAAMDKLLFCLARSWTPPEDNHHSHSPAFLTFFSPSTSNQPVSMETDTQKLNDLLYRSVYGGFRIYVGELRLHSVKIYCFPSLSW